jgi:hypothetical protein
VIGKILFLHRNPSTSDVTESRLATLPNPCAFLYALARLKTCRNFDSRTSTLVTEKRHPFKISLSGNQNHGTLFRGGGKVPTLNFEEEVCMQIRRKLLLGVVVLTAAGLTFPLLARHSAAAATPVPERHPVIRQALNQLRETREALVKEGAHDFKGHRVAAIKHIDAAIEELKLALAADKD